MTFSSVKRWRHFSAVWALIDPNAARIQHTARDYSSNETSWANLMTELCGRYISQKPFVRLGEEV
jgi:hypothetical protein